MAEIMLQKATRAGEVTDVPLNQASCMSFPIQPLMAVFNLDGEFVALDDTGSHGQALLCESFVGNRRVRTPPGRPGHQETET